MFWILFISITVISPTTFSSTTAFSDVILTDLTEPPTEKPTEIQTTTEPSTEAPTTTANTIYPLKTTTIIYPLKTTTTIYPTEAPTTEPPTEVPSTEAPTTTATTIYPLETTTIIYPLKTTTTIYPIDSKIQVKNCGTADELILPSNVERLQEFEADEGHLIRITVVPASGSTVKFNLEIWDDKNQDILSYMTDCDSSQCKLKETKVIVSHSRNVSLKYIPTIIPPTSSPDVTDAPTTIVSPIRLFYDCIPPTQDSQTFSYSQNNLIVMNLPPNSHINLNYKGDPIQKLNVSINLASPGQGFAAVSLGQGRFGVTSKSVNLVLDTGEDHESSVHLHTFNNEDNSTAAVSSDSGTITTPPPPTSTPVPTTTRMPPSQIVSVFVMGVDEMEFVMGQDMEKYKMETWGIITSHCDGLSNSLIHYHPSVSCRKKCFLSTGCVELKSDLHNIPPTVSCNTTVRGHKYPSLLDLYRGEINQKIKNWKNDFKARKVTVDSCTEIDIGTEWVWAVVILGVGAAFLAGAVAFAVNWFGKVKRRGGGKYRKQSWGEQDLQYKQGGVKSPWEIVDD